MRTIWQVDPQRKFERGLNSLDSIAQANGLEAKAMTGAEAPRLWAEGRHAEVINYCTQDVEKTRRLFELLVENHGVILRGDGQPITLPVPTLPAQTPTTPSLTEEHLYRLVGQIDLLTEHLGEAGWPERDMVNYHYNMALNLAAYLIGKVVQGLDPAVYETKRTTALAEFAERLSTMVDSYHQQGEEAKRAQGV